MVEYNPLMKIHVLYMFKLNDSNLFRIQHDKDIYKVWYYAIQSSKKY